MLRDTSPTTIVLNGQAADDTRVAAVYRCRLQPEQLAATDHPEIKFCDQCQQKVFKVTDFDGFEKAVASKGCVWGPASFEEKATASSMYFGMAEISTYSTGSPLEWGD